MTALSRRSALLFVAAAPAIVRFGSLMPVKAFIEPAPWPPVGSILYWTNERLPDGFIPCDGRLLTKYANKRLFDVIGHRYGAVDDKTFQIPDMYGALGTVSPGSDKIFPAGEERKPLIPIIRAA